MSSFVFVRAAGDDDARLRRAVEHAARSAGVCVGLDLAGQALVAEMLMQSAQTGSSQPSSAFLLTAHATDDTSHAFFHEFDVTGEPPRSGVSRIAAFVAALLTDPAVAAVLLATSEGFDPAPETLRLPVSMVADVLLTRCVPGHGAPSLRLCVERSGA